MKKSVTALPALALAAVFALAPAAEAQETSAFSAVIHGGAAFPSSDFGDNVDTGWGLGGDIEFAFHPRVGLYGGYSWFDFDADPESATSKGWGAGLRVILYPRDGVLPWARAGVTYMNVESGSFESDSEWGYQVGIGLDWPMGDVLTFTPMLRYQQYELDDENTLTGSAFDINYLTAEVGLKFNFGSVGL